MTVGLLGRNLLVASGSDSAADFGSVLSPGVPVA